MDRGHPYHPISSDTYLAELTSPRSYAFHLITFIFRHHNPRDHYHSRSNIATRGCLAHTRPRTGKGVGVDLVPFYQSVERSDRLLTHDQTVRGAKSGSEWGPVLARPFLRRKGATRQGGYPLQDGGSGGIKFTKP